MVDHIFVNEYASSLETGFGGRSYYLAKALADKGHKVLLITASHHHLLTKPTKVKWLWKTQQLDGFTICWVRTLPYEQATSLLRVVNWLIFALYLPSFWRFAHKHTKIACSSPSPVSFFGAFCLAKLGRSRLFFDVRDVWPESLIEIGAISPTHPLMRFLSYCESFACRHADGVTSNLKGYSKKLASIGLENKSFAWVPNGIVTKEIDQAVRDDDLELPDCFDKRKRYVTYTGTLGEANALLTMLDAAKLVMQKEPDLVFLIVGQGRNLANLQEYCLKNNISNVTFLGAVPKPVSYKIQALSAVLCIGSKAHQVYHYGVSPNKLYEYIYSGTPIAYYVHSPDYDPVTDSGSGLQVPAENAAALAEAIMTLSHLSDRERERMKTAARAYIAQHHHYETIAQTLESL